MALQQTPHATFSKYIVSRTKCACPCAYDPKNNRRQSMKMSKRVDEVLAGVFLKLGIGRLKEDLDSIQWRNHGLCLFQPTS